MTEPSEAAKWALEIVGLIANPDSPFAKDPDGIYDLVLSDAEAIIQRLLDEKEVEYQRKRIKRLETITELVNTCDGLPEFLTLVADLVSDSDPNISASLLAIASEMNDALAAFDKVEEPSDD